MASPHHAPSARPLADSTAEVNYMKLHGLPSYVEKQLGLVVKCEHPRPYEVLSLQHTIEPLESQLLLDQLETQTRPKRDAPTRSPRRLPDAQALASLDFDVFTYDRDPDSMLEMTELIFQHYRILTDFDISTSVFRTWLATVRCCYHAENPFHNFRHAFNVLQTMHCFLTECNMASNFDSLEIFALLFSCLCHDLQHPGLTNKFLTQTYHELARRYNNRSVLENHHCAVAFAILDSDSSRDITAALRPSGARTSFSKSERFRRFREMVIECILSTDVSLHKQHIQRLEAIVTQRGESGAPRFNKADATHRQYLMCALVEAADVSNEIRSFAFSRQWAPVVQQEFFRQGARERELGIPVPTMNDANAASLAKEQVGFINFVCLPLYEMLEKVFPAFEPCVRNLRTNKDTWAALDEV